MALNIHCLGRGGEGCMQLDGETYDGELPKPYDSEKKNRQGHKGPDLLA